MGNKHYRYNNLVLRLMFYLIILLFFFQLFPIIKQPNASSFETLLEKIVPITYLEQEDTTYQDFCFLEKYLQNKRIVLLGEQLHTDAKTFQTKGRIIRYLHQKLGYNVVLYESSMFDVWLMNNNPDSLCPKEAIFNFWWDNPECLSIWEYYNDTRKSSNPIILGGFDIQATGSYPDSSYFHQLDEYLLSKNIDVKNFQHFYSIKEQCRKVSNTYYAKQQLTIEKQKLILADLDSIINLLTYLPQSSLKDQLYYRQFINQRKAYACFWEYAPGELSRMNLRDSLMADNIKWLADSVYSNEKIIIWTANVHALSGSSDNKVDRFKSTGSYLKAHYGNSAFTITTSSYCKINQQGFVSSKLNDLSLEYLLHQKGYHYAYLFFNNYPAHFITGINQRASANAPWGTMSDMLIYIDTMTTISR